MASALYGTVVGSLIGGWPADRFGRKATLLWIGVLYFVGAVGSGLAPNVAIVHRRPRHRRPGHRHLDRGRSHVYLGDRAAQSIAGRLAGMFQFNIVFGILIAFVSNALLAGIGENAWRWMLGVAAFPSLLYAVFCLGLPESPRWLLSRKGDRADSAQSSATGRAGSFIRGNRSRSRRHQQCRRGRSTSLLRPFLDEALEQADPARHPDRVLQSDVGHQRDSLFRTAHF